MQGGLLGSGCAGSGAMDPCLILIATTSGDLGEVERLGGAGSPDAARGIGIAMTRRPLMLGLSLRAKWRWCDLLLDKGAALS
jgi:hypothetical protein